MHPWLQKLVTACTTNKDEDPFISFNEDPLGWSLNLQRHYFGQFSMATVQGNTVMEDHSQVDVAFHNALFLGIYDGHGGPDASRFVSDNLLQNLMRFVQQNEDKISETTLRDAVAATELDFLNFVRVGYSVKTDLGKIGSCCLVGIIRKKALHIANLGDSRAVLGFIRNNTIRVLQLTRDHNANIQAIREELKALHEGDPNIVMERNGSWRVKGIIEVSRSIGDTYLKRPDFTLRESFPRYEEVHEPFDRSVLSAEPEMHSRALTDSDKFLIFASDGLWEFLSNEQAVQIVHNNPRNGIAKRLLSTALAEACRRRGVSYKRNLQNAAPGRGVANRRSFHDDISVIVVFFDRESIIRRHPPDRSFRGSSQTQQESAFIKFRPKTSLMKSLSPRKGWEKLKQQFRETDQPSSSRAESSHAQSSWARSLRNDQAESSQAASARARPDQAESSQAASARARSDQAESSQAASARARPAQAESSRAASSRAQILRTDEAESSEARNRRTLSLRTPSHWDNLLQRFRSHRS